MKIILLICSYLVIAAIAVITTLQFSDNSPAETVVPGNQLAPEPPRRLPRPVVRIKPVEVDPQASIFGQQYAAHQLAAQSDVNALVDLLDEYLGSNDPFLGSNLAMIFLARLMEIDMQAAVDYANNRNLSMQQRQQLLSSILTTWARYDPESAVQYFASLTNMNLKLQVGMRLLQDPVFRASGFDQEITRALGKRGNQILRQIENKQKEPAQVFEEALASTGTRRQHLLMSAIINWYQTDPDAAIAALDNIPQPSDLRRVLQSLIPLAAQSDPFGAYDLAQRFAPGDKQVLGAAIAAMMAIDPEQGLPYMERHFDETGDPNLLIQGIMAWGNTDIQAAISYLDTLPDQISQRVGQSLAFNFVLKDPIAAMNWAIDSDSLHIQTTVASLMSLADISVAEAWLEQAADESIAATLLGGMANARVQHGFEEALVWVQGYEGEPGYEQAISRIVTTMAQTDPQRAADYLSDYAEDNGYMSAFVQVASSWGNSDPVAAKAWVGSLSDGQNREQAETSLIQGMANRDPGAALDMLNELGPERGQNLRLQIAFQLYARDGDMDAAINKSGLNEAQAETLRQNPRIYSSVMSTGSGISIISN